MQHRKDGWKSWCPEDGKGRRNSQCARKSGQKAQDDGFNVIYNIKKKTEKRVTLATGTTSLQNDQFLKFSRVDSAKCPLKNRVLGLQHFFDPKKPPKMTGFCLKKAEKPSQKGNKKNATKKA